MRHEAIPQDAPLKGSSEAFGHEAREERERKREGREGCGNAVRVCAGGERHCGDPECKVHPLRNGTSKNLPSSAVDFEAITTTPPCR